MGVMIGRTTCALFLAWLALAAIACGDKKDPLTPDNPNADPLMMDAGAAGPVATGTADPPK